MEFFPPGVLDDHPDLHALHERWYVSHLMAMQERPLHPPAPDQPTVFRLLFLPTFTRPALVRVTDAGGWRVARKQTDGRGGYEPGQLVSEAEWELTPGEAKRLGKLVERAGFWDLPTAERADGLDGWQCVVEGVRTGRYHVVDRWSPRRTPFAELVGFLLGLSPAVPREAGPAKYLGSFAELAERMRPRSSDGE
ncbi:hypothetical protein [Gemmata sp.]|uniref:hypothetical protein n=1 Tax=Gemmata sp. TaxID=1914242 RepID=UPI003F71B0BE